MKLSGDALALFFLSPGDLPDIETHVFIKAGVLDGYADLVADGCDELQFLWKKLA